MQHLLPLKPPPADKRRPRAPKPPPPDLPKYSWGATGPPGTPPRGFHYITNLHDANYFIGQLKGRLVGFDIEWKPNWERGAPENRVSLVQLADESAVLLIHISAMNWMVPRALKTVLEEETVLKLGVGIQGDADKIKRDLGIILTGYIDLSQLALSMDGGRWAQHRGKTVSLAKLTEAYVQRSLEKPKKIQRGNWERHLSMDMQEYAANDAASGLSVYLALEELRMTLPGPSSSEAMEKAKKANTGQATLTAKLKYREKISSIDSGVDSSSESTAALTSVTTVSNNATLHDDEAPRAPSVVGTPKAQLQELPSKDIQPLTTVASALTLLDRLEEAGSPSPGTRRKHPPRRKRAKTFEGNQMPNVSTLSSSTTAAQDRSRRPNKKMKA